MPTSFAKNYDDEWVPGKTKEMTLYHECVAYNQACESVEPSTLAVIRDRLRIAFGEEAFHSMLEKVRDAQQ